jgi:hypothetical protein
MRRLRGWYARGPDRAGIKNEGVGEHVRVKSHLGARRR